MLLKKLRIARQMTQLQLARKIHVDKSLISKWEHGVCEISPDMLKVVADVVGWRGDPYALMGQVGADE